MPVTATQLRKDIYRLLDQVLETGQPLELERKGQILRVEAPARPSPDARFPPDPGLILCEPDELVES